MPTLVDFQWVQILLPIRAPDKKLHYYRLAKVPFQSDLSGSQQVSHLGTGGHEIQQLPKGSKHGCWL